MRVCLWGTRGSIASAGPETVRYGGNTSCVEVEGRDGSILILDAGTGIRRLGRHSTRSRDGSTSCSRTCTWTTSRGWGSSRRSSATASRSTSGVRRRRHERPAHEADALPLAAALPGPAARPAAARLELHDVPMGEFESAACASRRRGHPPRPDGRLPDQPTGRCRSPTCPTTSRRSSRRLSARRRLDERPRSRQGVDLLIHDAQYTAAEYDDRIGWGHCACRTRSRSPSRPARSNSSPSTTTRPTTTTSSTRCWPRRARWPTAPLTFSRAPRARPSGCRWFPPQSTAVAAAA